MPLSSAYSQESGAHANYINSFQKGTVFYREGSWQEAAAEFRSAQESAKNTNDWSEALYWVIMSELSAADYGSALRDMDELERDGSARGADIPYHRGRAYFYLGYFEDALLQFKQYNDSASVNDEMRKASAYFWMGECLYSMGQFDKASEFYTWVLAKYPASSKTEASSYKLDLIKQKKIEAELLTLLKWSHEESLRTSEDYQQKIKIYESTLIAYQKRFSELSQNYQYQEPEESVIPQALPEQNANTLDKALQLRNELQQSLRALERINGGN